MVNKQKSSGSIFLGIGGWNFEPWRGVFYPKGLAHAKDPKKRQVTEWKDPQAATTPPPNVPTSAPALRGMSTGGPP